VSLEEYKTAKPTLIELKQTLKSNITELEQNPRGWFEPAVRFTKALKSGLILANEGTPEQKRDFLKKVGSNLTIKDRNVFVEPRGPWKLVVATGSFAQPNPARDTSRAAFSGENHQCLNKRSLLDKVRTYFKDNPGQF
jgi:hypothetical protein